jgi:stage II sporulation protein D
MSSSISGGRDGVTRRQFAGGLAALLACTRATPSPAAERQVRFGVFSLFEPRELTVKADHPLLLRIADRRFSLSPDDVPVCICGEGDDIRIIFGAQTVTASRLRVTSPAGGTAGLILAVPQTREHDGIRRGFQGCFDVQAEAGRLRPVVSMDMETAVASIIDAEAPGDAPLEFLMAQASASRSFLVAARTAHVGFDFCDTTHCQFLRGPAPAGSSASIAAARTTGLCLYYEGRPLAAMYSRSCSGRTCSLEELGLPVRDYPYYPIDCEFCLRHPETWERELNPANPPHGERERIAFGRIHGWSAIPSGSFTRQGGRLEGRGIGHGLGLCQRGAIAMAEAGTGFENILAHYYPNTNIAPASTSRDLMTR